MPESAFADLYHVSYPRLSAQISSYLGDPAEAEDVVQEAYLRTWRQWDKIARYDDPLAYLRRIAWNLATSRWRRLSVAARYLGRVPGPQATVEPQPDHVAVVTALRQLPDKQRRAIVLHYIADMPVDEIATELGAPRGTVLSWLHRGREQLSTLLNESDTWPPAPPIDGMRKRLVKRRRTKALALIVGLLATATAAASFLPAMLVPPPVVDHLTEVDWTRAALDLPGNGGSCPAGKQSVEPERGEMGLIPGPRDGKTEPLYLQRSEVRFGDLTGDGQPEAVLQVWCSVSGDQPDTESRFGGVLLVVQLQPDRSLKGLAYVGPPGALYRSYAIIDGKIVAQVQYESEHTRTIDAPAHVRTYQWNGSIFAQTSGRTTPLVLLPAKVGTGSAVHLAATSDCPARTVRFSVEDGPQPGWTHWADLDGDGNHEGITQIACNGSESVFLLTQGPDAFETKVLYASPGTTEILPESQNVSGNVLTLRVRDRSSGAEETVTMPVHP
ncbi:RNA polymerase sigma factor [Catelliglobosispora koreensis]|uniref:RNA polymerase sigma factor n=1 Tax=Catelliglobosispora koreensis TaxID=129052 RepID=UPI00036950F5|nr:SigE family RNA polymerase sigma factor [Catelliglobosispora koreensis]